MIRWTERAFEDFRAIHFFIGRDQPEAAHRQCELISEAIDQLRKFPRMGKRGRVEHDREIAVAGTPFVVTYRLRNGVVHIRRIRHGAQLR